MTKQEQRILEQAQAIRIADADRNANRWSWVAMITMGVVSFTVGLIVLALMLVATIGTGIWLWEVIDWNSMGKLLGRFAAIGLLGAVILGISHFAKINFLTICIAGFVCSSAFTFIYIL